MNAFRQSLEAHLSGQLALVAVEDKLYESLAGQPNLASAHAAIIEALYRGDRISGTTYLALSRIIQTFQQAQSGPQEPLPVTGMEETRLRPPKPVEGDKTRIRPPPPREVTNPAPREVTNPTRRETTNPTLRELTNPTVDATGASSSWTNPSRWISEESAPLGAGSVIKERFILENEIGRGGMGTVYKARDQRKVEAQDRNPYVAIKVLNEDFRRHPQSLLALQREARKAQKLAHPNIVTVHDFDRDGSNVYMVMELLEGDALDRVIKRSEGQGVGVKEALRIARDMCRAMVYAHEQGIVHADFKPANVFRTRKGVVKIFDFGIARAVKRGDQAEGAATVFDPATLGALTPSYASCEVIEGKDPDPRDDIYAMGCVIYELLTGKHPFKRMSAMQARDAGIIAEQPAQVPRWQWKALQRALAFRREDRPQSALALLDELLPLRRTPVLYVAAVAVAALIVGGMLAANQLAKYRDRTMTEALVSADAAKIEAVLPTLLELAPARRGAILLNDGARSGLIGYFEVRVNNAIDERKGRYDYPRALKLVSELKAFFPDSQAVKDLTDRLEARKADAIMRQRDWLDAYLLRGALIDAQEKPNVSNVLDVVRQIEPYSTLLRDERLSGAFADQVRLALQRNDVKLADELVTAGLALASTDTVLIDLRDRVRHANSAAQRGAVEVALEQPREEEVVPASSDRRTAVGELADNILRAELVDGLQQGSIELSAARRLRLVINELEARGDAEASQAASAELTTRLAREAVDIQAINGFEAAIRYARSASALFPESTLLKKTVKDLRAASAESVAQKKQALMARNKQSLDGLLSSTRSDDERYQLIDRYITQLEPALPASDPYLSRAKLRAADLYVSRATELREKRRLSEAASLIDRARQFGLRSVALVVEEQLIEKARVEQEKESRERARVAELEALKQKLFIQSRANEVADALSSFAELRTLLPPKDPFLTREAPKAIGEAYLRMASGAAREGRFGNAVDLVEKGREIAPFMSEMSPARRRFGRYLSINEHLVRQSMIDISKMSNQIKALSAEYPDEMADVRDRMAENLVKRINATADARLAERLSRAARLIFADQPLVRALGTTAAVQ